MDMSLSKLWEMVMDSEAWHAPVHGLAKTEQLNWTELGPWSEWLGKTGSPPAAAPCQGIKVRATVVGLPSRGEKVRSLLGMQSIFWWLFSSSASVLDPIILENPKISQSLWGFLPLWNFCPTGLDPTVPVVGDVNNLVNLNSQFDFFFSPTFYCWKYQTDYNCHTCYGHNSTFQPSESSWSSQFNSLWFQEQPLQWSKLIQRP